jgi:hypothetical protein
MYTSTLDLLDASYIPDGYQLASGYKLAQPAGVYVMTNPLAPLKMKVRMTDLATLTVTGTTLIDAFLFLEIDGTLSYYTGTAWAAVPLTALPTTYPTLGLSLSAGSVDPAILHKVFLDGKSHTVSPVLCFRSLGTTSPVVSVVTMTYTFTESASEVYFVRVYGKIVKDHSFPAISSFKIDLNRKTVVYGNSVLSPRDITVTVASDGTWETYLPDTDSMGGMALGYSFRFDPVFPLVRRVPRVTEIEFGSLPIASSV